jgi:catechol 2,3-dioxygenase
MAGIQGIRCVDLGVADLTQAGDFFGGIWGLRELAPRNDARFFRGTGTLHHILALYRAQEPAMIRVVFDAESRATVDQLHAAVAGAGVAATTPALLSRPGGGYGFGFKDPEGRNLAIMSGVADHAGGSKDEPDRPRKITHVNLNSAAFDETVRFFTDILGFRVADETDLFVFLRCNSDHHSIVIARADGPTLNHIAFEMPDLDSVMRGGGRLKDHGYPIEWGPGRHGAGNNVFVYFAGPEEFPIEYTAEVLQVDETYVRRGPDYWRFPPGRSDQWGITAPRSARLKRVQAMFRFTADGHRLD